MRRTEEIDILRQSGLRCTPQRVAILREVFSRRHPTAYEVFESVRRHFPTIGLATVYNTLRTMTERGLVAELPFSSEMRFDANMAPHANLVCRNCGRIEDVEFARSTWTRCCNTWRRRQASRRTASASTSTASAGAAPPPVSANPTASTAALGPISLSRIAA